MTTSKESISIFKKDNPDSKSLAVGVRNIQFAHQFVGGEVTLDLLNLTTPSELASNGFVNASPAEIASAKLSVFGRNLRLGLSRGVELKQFVHYVVRGNQIVFIGALRDNGGALTNEILVGEIVNSVTNGIMVGDVKFERGTILVSAGQTTVNLGPTYKVNANPTQQLGDVKLKLNGVELVRNAGNATASPTADGHYQEIDSGNGYGTTIVLNTAPLIDAVLSYDMGVRLSSGDIDLWNRLDTVEGILYKLADDLKDLGPYDITRYLATAPSALERRLFGDLVLAQSRRIALLETPTYVEGTVIDSNSTLADTYQDLNVTPLVLPSGQWEVVFEGGCYAQNSTAGNLAVLGNIAITNDANVIQDNANTLFGHSLIPASQAIYYPLRMSARVPGGGTYKLRVRSTVAIAQGYVGTGSLTPTGSLTNPDASYKWYARKIGV